MVLINMSDSIKIQLKVDFDNHFSLVRMEHWTEVLECSC